VPRSDDDDDEDISADVAESAVLAMEPDVPDTRKMLIRVRRKQTMAALAVRYGVSVGQLYAWNRTHRDQVAPGQVIVLHVPVGKALPSEPGPERIATSVQGGGVERIGTRVADTKNDSRYDKKSGRGRTGVVKVSDSAGKAGKSSESGASKGKTSKAAAPDTSSKSSKAAAASRPKTAAKAKKGN
jgi:membrane-bound lytic murein transglycosylase D